MDKPTDGRPNRQADGRIIKLLYAPDGPFRLRHKNKNQNVITEQWIFGRREVFLPDGRYTTVTKFL